MPNYLKLKDLTEIKVNRVSAPVWERWNAEESKMEKATEPTKDFKKRYYIDLGNDNVVAISSSQLGVMLEAANEKGQVDLAGKEFEVKNNGKEGMEIRYFFNLK